MRTSLCVMASLLIVGCNTAPTIVPDPVLVPQTTTVNIPSWLLEKCQPLGRLEVRAYNGKDTVTLAQTIIDQSDECRKKDSILVDTVIKAFNIKQQPQGSK